MKPEFNRTPAQMRKTIFRAEKPLLRKLAIIQGEGFTKDIGILWAAYTAGSFKDLPDDLDQAAFLSAIEGLQQEKVVWLIDDFNPAYKDKRGPVAMACTATQDLMVHAEGCAFKWATKRNVIRCSVEFLQMVRRAKSTGICMVKCNKSTATLMKHLNKKYRVINFIGQAAKDSFLYAIPGKVRT